MCEAPADRTGYDVTAETELNVATGFDVTVVCAENYESTGAGPAAASCGAASGPYSLGRINQEPSQHQDIQSISECLTGHTPHRKDQTRNHGESMKKNRTMMSTKMRRRSRGV